MTTHKHETNKHEEKKHDTAQPAQAPKKEETHDPFAPNPESAPGGDVVGTPPPEPEHAEGAPPEPADHDTAAAPHVETSKDE